MGETGAGEVGSGGVRTLWGRGVGEGVADPLCAFGISGFGAMLGRLVITGPGSTPGRTRATIPPS